MKVVEGQLPAIESKHSRTQADQRTFLKTVGASAVSVVGANAAFAEAAPESRQAAAESHPAEKPKRAFDYRDESYVGPLSKSRCNNCNLNRGLGLR
jgi:beta-N-acetylglucosaminidase